MPYLFTRSAFLAPGSVPESLTWATSMTEKVNAVADIDVSLWMTVMSPESGRITWTAVVEDLSALTVTDEKLVADDGYLALAKEGSQHSTERGVEDGLVRLVHLDPEGIDTAQYSRVVRAVLAPGSYVTGTELGVEIAQRAKATTGRPTSFGASQSGDYGEVGWITLFDSIDQVQAATEAMAADAGMAKLLDDKASGAYLAGHSTQTISRKIA